VSRIPRFQENLKAAFTAEAMSAARFRACAAKAEHDGLPNLAQRWSRLATAKDQLAIDLLEAAGQVLGEDADLGAAIAEERYENDVLYPKLIREDPDGRTKPVIERLLASQRLHLSELEAMRVELNAAQGDLKVPPAVDEGKSAGSVASALS
jgi:rubrerythrin